MKTNKKLLAVLSVPAITSLLAVAVATPVKAANRDFHDTSTKPETIYANKDYVKDDATLGKLIDAIGDHASQILYEFGGNEYQYDTFADNYYKAYTSGESSTAAFSTALDTTKKIPMVTVSSVDNVADVTVDNGTTADKLGLPTTVGVTLSDGTKDSANVAWNTTAFDGTKAGDQTITGTLSVPTGKTWSLTADQAKVTAKVTVKAPVSALSSVSVVNATTVQVVLNDKPAADLTNADASKFAVEVNGKAVAAPTAVTKVASDLTGKTYKLTIATLNGQQGTLAVNGVSATVPTGMAYGFDYEAPEVTNVVAKGNKTLQVTFSEKMDPATVVKGNIMVVKDGKELTDAGAYTSVSNAVLDSTGTVATLTLSKSITVADYSVVFGQDGTPQTHLSKDLAGNAVYGGTEVSFRPTAADLTNLVAPSVGKVEYNNGLGTVKLTFTKDVSIANLDATKLTIGGVAITSDAVKAQTDTNVITLTLSATNNAQVKAATGTLNLVSAAGAYTDGTTATSGESVVVTKTSPAVIQTAAYSQVSKILTLTFDQPVKLGTYGNIKVNSDTGAEATAAGATAVNADGTPVADSTVASSTWNLKLASAQASALEGDNTAKLKAYMVAGAVKNDDTNSTPNVDTTYANGGVAVTYTANTVNPVISSAVFDNKANTLKLYFNEDLDAHSSTIIPALEAASALKIGTADDGTAVDLSASGLHYGAGTTNTQFEIDGTNKKLLTLTLGTTDQVAFRNKLEAFYQSQKPIKVWVAANTIENNDKLYNTATTFDTGNVLTYNDYTAPALNAFTAGTDVLTNTKIKVSFSEKVDAATAQNVANYVIKDLTDTQLTVTKAELQADQETVYLTTATQVEGKPYNFTVTGVKDLAGNVMTPSNTMSFTGVAKTVTASEYVSGATATIGDNSKDDVIAVAYNEKPQQSLALDKNNYVVLEHSSSDASGVWTNATAVDLSDATLTMDSTDGNAKTVKIALGAYNLKDSTTYKVIASNVTDIYGNALNTNNSAVTAATTSNVPALVPGGITEVNQTSNAVTLVFDKELKNADVASNYSVGGSAPTKATYTWDATKKQATVVLDLPTALTAATDVKLTTDSNSVTNITNLAGKGFANATISAPQAIVDRVAPTVASDAGTTKPALDDDVITVTFDKAVRPADAINGDNYTITLADGTSFKASDLKGADTDLSYNGATNTVTIKLDNTGTGNNGKKYNLTNGTGKATITVSGVEDLAGNVISTVSKSVDVSGDTVKPNLSSASITGAYTINAVFSKDLDASTVAAGDFTLTDKSTGNTVAINKVNIASSDLKTVTITSATPLDGTHIYTVAGSTTASVSDLAGNAATTLTAQDTGAYTTPHINQATIGGFAADSVVVSNSTTNTINITLTGNATDKVNTGTITTSTSGRITAGSYSQYLNSGLNNVNLTSLLGSADVNSDGVTLSTIKANANKLPTTITFTDDNGISTQYKVTVLVTLN